MKSTKKTFQTATVKCTLTHIPTGSVFGEGVGACSTMEGKYKFRTGEVEFTGKPVPKDYWTNRDINLIGGKGFSTKKNDKGQWEIVKAGEKVEHDNPADYYNTVLKMAKKRAHVDAVLTATAASDIFTQDVEDMPEVINVTPKDVVDVAPAMPQPSIPRQYEEPPESLGQEPPKDYDETFVKIEKVESKTGTTNGKEWTAYFIHTATGGKYGTFSATLADLATTFAKEGKLVRLKSKPSKKGQEVISIEDDAA